MNVYVRLVFLVYLTFLPGLTCFADVVEYTARAMRILDRIAIASNTHGVKPAIMVGKTPSIGHIDFRRRLIVIDSSLFALTDNFGEQSDNILAYVIGHEYAHFVRGHDFDQTFAHQFGSFASIKPINTDNGRLLIGKQAESESDYYGLYYALLAGFDITAHDVEKLWKLTEQEYGLSIDSSLAASLALQDVHPATNERVEIANRVIQELRDLALLHEVANVALMTGEYLQAAVLYEHVCKNVNIPSVNWNELLARYLYLQELSRRHLVDPKMVRQQYAAEFAYRSRDRIVKLDIEQTIFRCRSLIEVLQAARYNDSGVNRMDKLLVLFEEAKECGACSLETPCSVHKSRAKAIEEEISESTQLTGEALNGKIPKIEPSRMLAVSAELDKQKQIAARKVVPLSVGDAQLYSCQLEGKTLLRYTYLAPRARAAYRIDMAISRCSKCEVIGMTQQDNIIQQSVDGKIVESAFFAE